MNKHTPGPWHYDQRKVGHQRFSLQVFDAKGKTVADVAWRPAQAMTLEGSIGEANGHLLAAAPDTLQALEALTAFVVDVFEEHSEPCDFEREEVLCSSTCEECGCVWRKISEARAAIMKATGEPVPA